ncbi:pentapeptide repeat-containing protein [Modestobacter marinus]|uniref:pentapeptide repeat-containing protein n=1 Tax=Modestobacter marinus TaxID=477641 RepID=UPI00166C4F4C
MGRAAPRCGLGGDHPGHHRAAGRAGPPRRAAGAGPARLTHARLTHARLTHARLTHARLTHARLTHARLTHARLTHARLTPTPA